jgi:ERCC4-type nuclease
MLKIVIDSREQMPYLFIDYPCSTKRRGLSTGDYSLEGYEEEICIERKSKSDLYSSLGMGERDLRKSLAGCGTMGIRR